MGLLSLPLVVALAAAFVAYKIWSFFFSESPSPNPFQKASSSDIKPKVIDQKQRDSVLKQGFSRNKVPDNLDAIVIGSGIGGLASAAILAKAGKKVLVLEQHDQAGGCCHTFIDKGYEFDVGIHYIGEMQRNSITRTYLDHITDNQLEWVPLSDEYDEVIFLEKDKESRRYPVHAGGQKWKESLKKRFPEESANIDKFFKLMEEVESGKTSMFVKFLPLWTVTILDKTGLLNLFTNFYKWNSVTCKEVVWGLTQNQELRDIFCYCFGDFGTPPSKAGFPMQTLLHTHFMKNGGFYPVGGASEIAFHIIPVIESAGGKVLVRAEVQGILMDPEGKACGVQVKKGSEQFNLSAPLVISNTGVYNTLERLLPLKVASSSRLWSLAEKSEHGPGAMSVFVGLNCPVEELDIIHKKNAWVFSGNDIDKLTLDYLKLTRDEALDVDIPLLFISFPSTKDPEWDKKYPGKTTMAIVTLMPYEWLTEWEDKRVMKRGDDYDSIKNAFGDKAVQQACKLFPSIKNHIDYVSVGTPLSNRYYLGAPKGEIYGLDHTRERFSVWNNAILRPKTDVPGLYLTGQDICSCGFTGALWGGFLSAAAILQRNIMKDLAALHKSNKTKSKTN